MPEIVIIGAGLTGLSTAYHLEKNGFRDFKIFEKNDTPGGLLRSFQKDGFTFDFTGHLLHINDKYFRTFLEKIFNLNSFNLSKRNSAIFIEKKFVPYPIQTNLYELNQNTIIKIIEDFINRKKSLKNPKNFYEWVEKYFGLAMGEKFFFPYNSKLLAFDVKKITPSWTGRFVPKTNLHTILNSAFKETQKNNVGYNSCFYYPKNGGIQFLIDKLENKIKEKVNTNFEAKEIDLKTKTIFFENGHKEKFGRLITTIPLKNLLKTLKENSKTNLKAQADKLICNSVINFNLGINKNNVSNKHWVYFPEKKYSFYRAGFWNNISKSLVPSAYSSIYGEISHISGTKTDNELKKLEEISIKNCLEVFNLKKSDIVIKETLNLSNAYVIYDFWRERNLRLLHKRLNSVELYSIGRYGEWKYSSMQEAVLDGKLAAEKILEDLKEEKSKFIDQQNFTLGKFKTGKRIGL